VVLLPASFSLPARRALTQLSSVFSTIPRLRDAAAMLWPDLDQPRRLLPELRRVLCSLYLPHLRVPFRH
jgi:hypothetical protein